jgi:hypothetical protein
VGLARAVGYDVAMKRRLQFRLRTLMIGVTLLAVPCSYVGWQEKIVRDRIALKSHLENTGKGQFFWVVNSEQEAPWLRRVLGDKLIDEIGLTANVDIEERSRIRATFPEADLVSTRYPVPTEDMFRQSRSLATKP